MNLIQIPLKQKSKSKSQILNNIEGLDERNQVWSFIEELDREINNNPAEM